ncbi:MAG: CRISPR-associated endonuclease Cas1 [Methanophagales archaeon ANME-1-THS]|nr:MAG: CRISPR-associated endonuclease Cas1 [Methanophagales archaeon ANME-1-THS]
MQLVINTYGSYLRKKGNCFLVRKEDKVFEVSVNRVDSILIATAAYISTDAIKFAVENNIDIVFLDSYGDPYGRVWHPKLGSTTLIRRRQLELYEKEEGLNLAKKWGVQKFDNQIEFLKRLKKTRAEKKDELESCINEIEQLKERMKGLKGTVEERRQTILGIEGMASRTYFEALSSIVPDKFKFDSRSRNPARDGFNAMLNYGYGVLYSMVEKACIISGLDPYIGFLHTDNYNKKSLVFDIIEMFRTFVDETVVHLFSKREVKEEYFDKIQNGVSLNKEGKAVLIEALNETFEKTIKYKGRNIKTKNVIQFECHRIANKLLGKV